jgi:sugar lactone lactonase YvrE
MRIVLVLFAVAFAVASAHAESHRLAKKWETEAQLKIPESVYFDAGRKVLYVSNIDGEPWGNDGKGSIAKVGLDGKIIAVDWISGLNAPKGIAMRGSRLYVGDLTNVVVIDIDKGAIAERIAVPGSEGLNDVAIDSDGVVYVSDTKTKKVFAIKDGRSEAYLENLKGPNGLLFHDGALYLLDGEGLYRVGKDRDLTLLSDGMKGGVDGVENVTGNDFIVSCWQGTVHYVKGDGTREVLLDTHEQKINSADIGYDSKQRIVYVPTFLRNTVVAYDLK